MGIDASSDLVVLLISKYMGAKAMGEYEFDMFKKGCEQLGCDSIASFKAELKGRLYPELK